MATSNSTSSAQSQSHLIFLASLLPSRSLKMWTIGVILSALAYGIEITLAFYCFQLLSKPSNQRTSRQARRVLLFFITFMCLIGTTGLVISMVSFVNALTTPINVLAELPFPIQEILLEAFTPLDLTLIVLATWGSHGSMLWRCIILYGDLPRMKKYLFFIFAGLIVATSLLSGIMSIITIIPFSKDNGDNTRVGIIISAFFIQFELASLCTNLSLSILSIGRILYHLLYLRKLFGKGHTSVYGKVVMILIESSILTLLLDILVVAASATPAKLNVMRDLMYIHEKLLLHVNIIAPILIIFRVAQGATLPCSTQKSPTNKAEGAQRNAGQISTLRFAGGIKARGRSSFESDAFQREAEIESEKVEPEEKGLPELPTDLYLEYQDRKV